MSAKLQQTPGGGEESMLAVDIEHGTNTHGKEERPKPVHEITETSLPHDKEARVPTPGDTEGSELQSLSRPEKWNTLQRAWNWKPSPARRRASRSPISTTISPSSTAWPTPSTSALRGPRPSPR
ncbi:hypothetical protein VTI28DRAFT_1678 [Corynascus sepedonium]